MARINIEDQFWKDIIEVAARMGDSDRAVGQALKLIQLGQERFKAGRPILVAEFDAKFSRDLIPEFARIDGDRVIVAGAGKHFAWLRKKSEAGKIGGASKSPKKTKTLKQNRNTPKQNRSTTEAKTSTSETSSSSSYSSSLSVSPSSSVNTPPEGRADKSAVSGIVALYCDLYQDRCGARPPVTGKDAGILGRLVKDLGPPKVREMLEAYFQMPDAWAVASGYALELFLTKRNEIQRFISTGKVITRSQASQADKTVGTKQRWADEERRMLDESKQQGLFENPTKQIAGGVK